MFLLFAYARYYPEGAYRDFVCKYNTFKECFEHALKSTFEFTEIYNALTDEWYEIYSPDTSNDRWFRNLDSDSDDEDFDNEEKGRLLTDELIQELFKKFE